MVVSHYAAPPAVVMYMAQPCDYPLPLTETSATLTFTLPLTEERMRLIIREELAALEQRLCKPAKKSKHKKSKQTRRAK